MTESHDDETAGVEAYLREFRVRDVVPLAPVTRQRRGVWIAAVAASIVAAVIANEMRRPQPALVRPRANVRGAGEASGPMLFEASRLAADPDALDRWMLDMSRTVLPDPERPDSSLRVLTRQ